MMQEIWKSLNEYDGIYQVSNLGRIRSLIDNHQNKRIVPKVKKARIGNSGYLYVNLRKDGKPTSERIHRLVASYFCEKPVDAQCVNHINGIKTDNRAENLEWCTYSENSVKAYEMGLKRPTKDSANGMYGIHGKDHPSSKPILQYSLDGNLIAEYESGIEAGNALGVDGSSIQRCARGDRKTAFGYRWRYKGC